MLVSPDFILIKAFVRQALKDANGDEVADLEIAIQALEKIQAGHFETSVKDNEDGTLLVSSTVSGKTFNFAETSGLTSERIMVLAEKAIEFLEECDSVADAKSYLRPARSYTQDYTDLRF